MELEGGLAWSVFDITPRTVQRTHAVTADALHVDVNGAAVPSQPLRVLYSAQDAASGTDLTGISRLLVNYDGRWIPLPEMPVGLITGTTWRFRIDAEGYAPVEYSLLVRPSQEILTLDAQLEPRK